MSKPILRLLPYSKDSAKTQIRPVELELSSEEGSATRREDAQLVCSTIPYTGELTGTSEGLIPRALYVNSPEFEYRIILDGPPLAGGTYRFHFPRPDILQGCYGRAQFIVHLQRASGEDLYQYTPWVPVYVNPKDPDAEQVCRAMGDMAHYVLSNCTPYWGEVHLQDQEALRSMVPDGLVPSFQKSLAARIRLLDQIVRTYERVLPFFRTGSKYRVSPEKQWASLRQASHLTSDTFRGILQHPHRLMPVQGNGIRIGERSYLPHKVIAAAGQENYDIYENRYVVGFLRCLQDDLIQLQQSIVRSLREQVKKSTLPQNVGGYVDSSYWAQQLMIDRLEKQLNAVHVRVAGLHAAYGNIFAAIPQEYKVHAPPRPTAIFRTVHHYQSIYGLACQWFRFGVHDFRQEDMFLPFLADSQLYEYYLLIKLLCHLERSGFTLKEAGHCGQSGSSELRPNRYQLHRGDLSATIFYNIKITGIDPDTAGRYPGKSPLQLEQVRDGLCLHRVNPYDLRGNKHTDRINPWKIEYQPDYVIKFQRGDGPAGYVILDAKFSTVQTTRTIHMPALCYKYLVSLSPVRPEDRILGLGLVYGKPKPKQDRQAEGVTEIIAQPVSPQPAFVRLIELRTENESQHERMLSNALGLRSFENYEAVLRSAQRKAQQDPQE